MGRGTLPTLAGVAGAIALLALLGMPAGASGAESRSATGALGAVIQRVVYYNPVFGRVFPDPAVLRVGRTYYAYGTTTGRRRRDLFPILRSRNLVHWRHAGYALRRPPRFSYARWWAPSPLRWRGRYYLFYSAHARRPDKMCVAVATARRPVGPFRHRARLACGGKGGSLDPAPLVAGNRVLLYFSRTSGTCARIPGRCSVAVARLSSDLLRVRGGARRVLGLSQEWERRGRTPTIENPWVMARGGRYYLLYSAGDWQHHYGMGYAVSRSPLGPFVKPEPLPFLHARRGLGGPGGGSVVTGPRGAPWLIYHARRTGVGYANDRRRSLHIDPLAFPDGRVRVQGPSLSSSIRP